MKKLAVVALVALGLIVGTAACSSGGDDDSTSSGASDSNSAANETFNPADVEFLQGMIPHHAQAIEMADLATNRAGSASVKDLAARIRAAQQPEIDTMTGWLRDWGKKVPSTEHGASMDMGDGDMGMMSNAEMSDLRADQGSEFDTMFLEMMVRHHEGAVAMAENELNDGKFVQAKALAQTIIDAQESEITQMNQLLAR